jgi:hypothetical protein
MDRLATRINRSDPDFTKRREHNLELISGMRERLDAVSLGE